MPKPKEKRRFSIVDIAILAPKYLPGTLVSGDIRFCPDILGGDSLDRRRQTTAGWLKRQFLAVSGACVVGLTL